METVGSQVHQIVQKVTAGGRQTEADKRQGGRDEDCANEDPVRRDCGHKHEDILDPLVISDGLQNRPWRNPGRMKFPFHGTPAPHHGDERSGVRYHNRVPGRVPDGKIRAAVTGIIELACAEGLHQRSALGRALEIQAG
jgi:hypothetical protein